MTTNKRTLRTVSPNPTTEACEPGGADPTTTITTTTTTRMGADAGNPPPGIPDPEVPEQPSRRRFTAAFKLRILREADACRQPGQLGALLRREGLYSSHLQTWRKQAEGGALSALSAHARGPKPARRDAVEVENERLRRENEHLLVRLTQAEAVIEIQKKLSQLLPMPRALAGGAQ